MTQSYREELVTRMTEDGVVLTGLSIRSTRDAPQPLRVVWIHGNTGTFYEQSYITIGRHLAAYGHAFLTGNTRGHDITTTLWRQGENSPAAGGSAWERLEDAPVDLGTWVDEAAGEGQQPVVLIGHSLGGVKAILYQSQRHDPRVRGLVLASPALPFHYPADTLDEAQRLVAAGQGDELLPPQFGDRWYRLSAGTLVDRATVLPRVYEMTGEAPIISRITTPVLAFFGEQEAGGERALTLIRQEASSARRVDVQMIDGADHGYTGCELRIAGVIAAWMRTLL